MIRPLELPEQAARIAVRRDEDGLGLERSPDPSTRSCSRISTPASAAASASRRTSRAGCRTASSGWKSAPGKRPARGSGSSSRHSATKPSSCSASYSARSSSPLVVSGQPEAARPPDRVAAQLDSSGRRTPPSDASNPQRRTWPSHSRALSYAIAPPRRANPPLRPLAPEATARASCSRTLLPRRASVSAAETPVTPPPTIATSAAPRSG